MPARTYACPSCGAQVDEQGRHCRYCGAPVATVRCAACFHMNVPDAGYCSGCGSQLGLEPVGEATEHTCPVCKKPLEAYRDGAGAVFDCGSCGGQFVDHAMLRQLVERSAHPAPLAGAPPRVPWRPEPRTGYIPCPACAALMNRKNYGGIERRDRRRVQEARRLVRSRASCRACSPSSAPAGSSARSSGRRRRRRARSGRPPRRSAAVAAPTSSHDPSLHTDVGAGVVELLADLLLR